MKSKKNPLVKILTLLILILALIMSCDTDENLPAAESIVQQTPSNTRKVAIDDIPTIQKYLKFNISSDRRNTSNGDYAITPFGKISLDNITELIDNLGNDKYTFPVIPKNLQENKFFNLVINQNLDQDVLESYIIEYNMDALFADDFAKGDKGMNQYSGSIKRYDASAFLSAARPPTTCDQNAESSLAPCNEIPIDEGSSENNNGGSSGTGGTTYDPNNIDPDSGSSDSGGSIGSSGEYDNIQCSSTIQTSVCNGGGGHYGEEPECTGTFQGSTILITVCSDGSIYIVDMYRNNDCNDGSSIGILPTLFSKFDVVALGLSAAERECLNRNCDLKNEMYQYLNSHVDSNNNYEIGAVEFIQQVFGMIDSDCNFNGEINLELINDLNNEFCDNLTDDDINWTIENPVLSQHILSVMQQDTSAGCSDIVLGEFISIINEIPEAKFERYKELKNIIKNDPWALIQDCALQNGLDTSNYIDLFHHIMPQECQSRLNLLGSGFYSQPISDGNVPLANLDYYGIEITSHPDFDNDGFPDNEAEIYQAFRQQFTNLASGEMEDFQFSCNVPFNSDNTGDINWQFVPFTENDGNLFLSNNPLSAIFLIEAGADIPGIIGEGLTADEGAIILSGFTGNAWTISTIHTPDTGTQPFSGNRQWGWLINQNGNLEIFTRAVDIARISSVVQLTPGNEECRQDTYYNIAEATWINLQQEVAQWVNDNGGQASIVPKTAVRVKREKIEELLISNNSIGEIDLSCD